VNSATQLGEAIGGLSSVVIIALCVIALLVALLVIGMLIRGVRSVFRKRKA
jgi:hypothetical protein